MAARRQSGYLQKHTVTTTGAWRGGSGGAGEASRRNDKEQQTDGAQKEQLTKFLPESERLEQEGEIFWDAEIEK